MKLITIYLVLTAVLLASCGGDDKATEKGKTTDSIPVMVMQIKKCSKLYTAEYVVHKIVTHDDNVKLKGKLFNQDFNIQVPMSSRKIAIPIEAKLKAYIDFGNFSEKNLSVNGDKVEIILPDPKVEMTSSRINHDEIKKHVSLIRSNFTDAEMAGYQKQGREDILKTIPQLGIIDMAKESATHILVPLLTRLGYDEKNITITFRKQFTVEDLPMLLDNNNLENGKQQQ